jgi:hypothetical protein
MGKQLAERQALIVHLSLIGVEPVIWRRLRLASDLNLASLHVVTQIAMGWGNEHLHAFQRRRPARGKAEVLDLASGYEVDGASRAERRRRGLVGEADVRCGQMFTEVGDKLEYTYDFGDNWEHVLGLEKVEPWPADSLKAVCLAGARACPPEDCGGVWAYMDLLTRLAEQPKDTAGNVGGDNPGDYGEDSLEWILGPDFDPDHFDLDAVNDSLANVFAGK